VFSSAHRLRRRVIPPLATDVPDNPQTLDPAATAAIATPSPATLARRLDWAALLQRVFTPDITTCPRCGAALTVFAFITAPDVITRILAHLGLPSAVPAIAPARAPPTDHGLDPQLAFTDL